MDKTKRLAIEQLERISKNLAAIGETVDYIEFAIEALAQESCEDCISREAVDRIFQRIRGLGEDTVVAIYEHILDLPSVQPKSSCSEKLNDCEDCISRQAAIKAIWDGTNMDIYTSEVKEILEGLPSVQPKAKIGHWIKTIGENGITSAVRCSECGFEDNRYTLFRYCPKCGAKMEGQG